ncbi:MAG: TonB-dependent receptor, partial [Alphaproteobacteria bacterium]
EFQTNTDEDQTDVRVAGIAGVQGENYGIIASLEYLDRTALTTAEKRLSSPTDDLSALGMPGAFFTVAPIPVDPLTGAPTASPVFIPALGDFATIPARTPFIDPTGCAQEGGIPLRASASAPPPETGIGFCGFDFGDFFNLVPKETRLTGYIEGRYDITDWFQVGVEVGFSRNRALRNNSPTFPVLTFPVVLPDHPNFPDFFKNIPYLVGADTSTTPPTGVVQFGGLPIAFFGRPLGNGAEPSPNRFKNDTWRAAVKGTVELGGSWFLDAHFLHAQNDFTVLTRDVIADAFQAALLGLGGSGCDPLTGTPGVGPCQYFNPFATNFSTAPNDPDVIDSFLAFQELAAESDLTVAEAVLSGDLFELPAGSVGIAAGIQYRKEKVLADYDAISNNDGFAFLIGNPDYRGDRDILGLFGELRVPLTTWAEVQAAVRYEDYGGLIGSTTDPKVALLVTPNDWLALRGSWGTAFRAPSVFQQVGSSTVLEQVGDPITGGTFFAAVRTFGSEAIQPEDSKAYNLGATLQPNDAFTFDIDYWHFKFTSVIIRENAQAVLNAFPQDPTRVIRAGDPLFGPVVQIRTNFVNASRVTTDGIDFKLRYRLDSGLGTFTPSFIATYVDSYTIVDPQAGVVKGVGNRNFTNFGSPTPRWRFNAGLNWATGRHSANVFVRYIDSIKDDQNPGAKVGTFTTVDAQYNISLGDLFSVTQDVVLTVGSINLFDKEPPHVATNGGYESRLHDPRGRMVYVRLKLGF